MEDFQDIEDPLAVSDTGVTYSREQTIQEFTPTRVDALGVALTQDNLVGTVANVVDDFTDARKFTYDPEFDIRDHREMFQDVDSAYWDELRTAKSLDHLRHLHREYGQYSKSAQYLDELGIEGALYRFASVVADVPFITAIQKVRGLGKVDDFLDKLNSSYAGRALFAGTIEGSFEAVKQVASPVERTELDILLAVGAGGLIGGIYNPRNFDDATQQVLKTNTQQGINTKTANTEPSKNKWFTDRVEDTQFNITSVFKNSASPTIKALGSKLFNDVLNPDLDDFKAIEVRDKVKASLDSAFSTNFDPVYMQYMEQMYGKKYAIVNRMNIQKQEEFFNLVGDYHYGRPNPKLDQLPPEVIKKLDEAIVNMSEQSYDILRNNGHIKFTSGEIGKTTDYMPMRWLRDKIKAGTRLGKFKRSDFQKAVLDGLRRKFTDLGIEVKEDKLKLAAKKFTNTMYKEEIQGGKSGYIMQDNALKKAIDELEQLLELEPEDVKLLDDMMKKSEKKGTASATKRRTPLDLEGSYTTKDGFTIVLKDYLDTNIQSAWAQYGNSMGGDTALRQLGINSRSDLQKLRNKVEKELRSADGSLSRQAKNELSAFDATMSHLLGITTKSDPDGDSWKMVRMLNNLTRAAKLGFTWAAMAAEMARVTHQLGFKNLRKALPALRDVTRAYQGKEASALYRELQLHEALGFELNQMASIAKYEDLLSTGGTSQAATMLDKAERFGDIANEVTMIAGGVKSGTAYLEYLHAIGARIKMMDMAAKGLDDKAYYFFEQYGFSREMADKIAEQMRKFGNKDPNAPLLNLDQWDDNLGHIWSLGVRRKSYQLIQRSNFGDNVGLLTSEGKLVGDTYLGSLALNLKNYMIVAHNKQLSKGLIDLAKGGKDRMDTMGNWAYQSVFAATSYTAKQYALYWNDEEKLEKNLELDRILANSFSMTTFSAMIPAAVDLAAQPITGEAVFNTYAKTGGGPAGLPTLAPLDYATDVAQGAITVGKLISPWADASEYELKKALSVLPLGNAIGIKSITAELAELLAEK